MIEIFCQKDIDSFKTNSSYPPVFAEYLQARFNELKKCLEEFFEDEGEFNLKEFGHMVVLQKSDNLRDLSEVGLNACDNGFFGSIPEVVEEIEMPSFTVYQVSDCYNNDYMMLFYLPKGEFEAIYPELSDYFTKHIPEKIQFKPKGDWKPSKEKEPKYLFNGHKYKTQGVDLNVSEKIQTAIWNYIESRKNSGKIPLDYLQIFHLRPEKMAMESIQVIECVQEVPEYKETISFPSEFPITEKIYLIDDVDHQTMLLASEY